MSSKRFSRNIGRIKKMQDFCNTRGLHVRSISDDEEPVNIAIDAIKELIDRNRYIPCPIDPEDVELYGVLMDVNIYFNGNLVTSGRMRVDDAETIINLDERFMVDTKMRYNSRYDKMST